MTTTDNSTIDNRAADDTATTAGADFAVSNVRAVLPDRLVENATVVVTDGRIAEIAENGPAPDHAVDGRGLLLLPGLVDSHSDGLEKEIRPRRTAEFPLDYAIGSFEGRLRAAGVTTVFHGIGYQDKPRSGRSVDQARRVTAALSNRQAEPSCAVDHCVLYRFEARDGHALDPLLDDLDNGRTMAMGVPVVSFEDHTPGQGQYRDVARFEAAVDPTDLPEGTTVQEHVAGIIAEAEKDLAFRDQNLSRLAPRAREGDIRMLAHDVATVDDVTRAAEAGAVIAEFPVTREAAVTARERGMMTVMGGPNALRGLSHSGNASAREMVAQGLCDVLASDYLPTALLASTFILAEEGLCSLPEAIALVTDGPARMCGLDDRGRVEVGRRADLVLVDDRSRWPLVVGSRRSTDDDAWTVFG